MSVASVCCWETSVPSFYPSISYLSFKVGFCCLLNSFFGFPLSSLSLTYHQCHILCVICKLLRTRPGVLQFFSLRWVRPSWHGPDRKMTGKDSLVHGCFLESGEHGHYSNNEKEDGVKWSSWAWVTCQRHYLVKYIQESPWNSLGLSLNI